MRRGGELWLRLLREGRARREVLEARVVRREGMWALAGRADEGEGRPVREGVALAEELVRQEREGEVWVELLWWTLLRETDAKEPQQSHRWHYHL